MRDYREAVEKLAGLGLIYPSFESRAEIARLVAQRGDRSAMAARSRRRAALSGRREIACAPDERERLIAQGMPYALRLDMAAARARAQDSSWIEHGEGPGGESGIVTARPEAWGDVILARKETPTSYHLSVVIDDALQGVTDVVRGQDLFWSTSVHRLLQQLLGIPQPAYRHHRLIDDASGQKLSKSTKATALRELRGQGATPADIRRLVGLSETSVVLLRVVENVSVTSAAVGMPCWPRQGRGIMAANIALTARHTAGKKAASEKARIQRRCEGARQAQIRRRRSRHGRDRAGGLCA